MSDNHWDFAIIWYYRSVLLNGLSMTLAIILLTLLLGIMGGLVLAVLSRSRLVCLKVAARAMIELIRAVPPLVLVVWAYYCLPILTGLRLSSYWTCVIALALYGSVFFAEIFRSGIQSVEPGLIEAALSIGMSPWKVFCRVTAPLAFLRILPAFVGQCVMSIKNSVLGSYIAVGELLYEGQRLSTSTFRPLETLTAVAFLFALIILPLSLTASCLERKIQARYFRRPL